MSPSGANERFARQAMSFGQDGDERGTELSQKELQNSGVGQGTAFQQNVGLGPYK